jgi:FMN phosphatase YigB (HAD superfamily)
MMLRRHGVKPDTACMIEDIAVNLEPAKALGMATVWLKGGPPGPNRQTSALFAISISSLTI